MLGRAQKSSGSGFAFQPTFGLGLDRACKFLQTSGSGPSGFTFEVRAFGLSGLLGSGLNFTIRGTSKLKNLYKKQGQLNNLT